VLPAYPIVRDRDENLGLRILYEILKDRPDRLAERCVAPRRRLQTSFDRPESRLEPWRPAGALREFDVIGVSLGYELTTRTCWTCSIWAACLDDEGRTEGDPL